MRYVRLTRKAGKRLCTTPVQQGKSTSSNCFSAQAETQVSVMCGCAASCAAWGLFVSLTHFYVNMHTHKYRHEMVTDSLKASSAARAYLIQWIPPLHSHVHTHIHTSNTIITIAPTTTALCVSPPTLSQALKESPLFLASSNGFSDVVNLLLDSGALINKCNVRTCSLFKVAVGNGETSALVPVFTICITRD